MHICQNKPMDRIKAAWAAYDALEWFVAVSGGTVIWLSRSKLLYPAVKGLLGWAKTFITFPYVVIKRLDVQDAKLTAIEKEVKPNGGGSLRDVVTATNRLALLASLQTKQIIYDTPTPTFQWETEDGDCVLANPALCELFGRDSSEMLGSGWLAGIDYRERERGWREFQQAIQSDTPYSWEYHVTHKRTHEKYLCRVEMVVLRDSDGTPIIYQGTVKRL